MQNPHRPILPPVPPGIKESLTHQQLLSPKPQRPRGGAVDRGTTATLEQRASYIGAHPGESTSSSMGSSTNPRIAAWVASTQSAGASTSNGNGNQYHQQQQQPYYQQPHASTSLNNGFAAQAAYPAHAAPPIPRVSTPQMPGSYQYGPQQVPQIAFPEAQQPQQGYGYEQQPPSHPRSRVGSSADPHTYGTPLHDSFSNLSLGYQPNQPNNYAQPPIQSSSPYPNEQYSRPSSQALDPYRTPTPAGQQRTFSPGPAGVPLPNSRRSSLLPPSAPVSPAPSPASSNGSASGTLCIALPTQNDLANQRESAAYASNPATARVAWAKAVMKFVERHQASSASSSSSSPDYSRITDPVLVKWTDEALRLIISSADLVPPVPEALYLRGELANSGKFPSYRAKDTATAFRDFEQAANAGYHAAWAKIALAYETFGEQNNSQADFDRAKKSYEEGVRKNEVTCTYRMAMAHLLGQLGLPPNPSTAIPLLRHAAALSTADDPLPAYIYGMLLCSELDLPAPVLSSIPPHLLLDEYGRSQDPRPWVEKAAYLGYAPAQFKMGFNYEYAGMGCSPDPLLSVQYYSLASQQGDIEADMALSKWFLCGSEAFEKQEDLAYTFAEKAARKGLPSAMFGMGYFSELGIGCTKDLEISKAWYTKAAEHGNTDAPQRLEALNANNELSRKEHEHQINDKIVRRRTQAQLDANGRKRRSEAPPMPGQQQASGRPPRQSSVASMPQPAHHAGGWAGPSGMTHSDSETSLRRRETMKQVEQAAGGGRRVSSYSSAASMPSAQPYQPSNSTNRPNAGGHASLMPTPQPYNGRLSASPAPLSRPQSAGPALHPNQRRENSLAAPAHVQRYSLVDSGPASTVSAPPAPTGPPAAAPSAVSMAKPPTPKYQSFQEMGITAGSMKKEQDCIIS